MAGLAEVQRHLAATAGRWAAASGRAAHVTGSDPTSMVRVTLDGDGRAESVSIATTWRSYLDVPGLADAVVAAMGDAYLNHLQTWAETAAAPEKPGAAPGRPADPTPPAGTGPVVGLRAVLDALEAAEEQLDRVAAQDPTGGDSPGFDDVVVFSTRRKVAAVARAGEVLTVEFDDTWITTASLGDLITETTSALRAAYDNTAVTAEHITAHIPALAVLSQLSGDPDVLRTQLGLQT